MNAVRPRKKLRRYPPGREQHGRMLPRLASAAADSSLGYSDLPSGKTIAAAPFKICVQDAIRGATNPQGDEEHDDIPHA